MAKLGDFNKLRVVKQVDFGVYLDGGELGEILLPTQYLPKNCSVNDEIDVFLYCDSEDRLIATTLKPKAKAGEFAFLEVTDVNRYGAFMDWGLPKDLFVAYGEQERDMQPGKSYTVYIYLSDNNTRIAASSRLDKYLKNIGTPQLENNQQVSLLVTRQTDLGYQVIIDSSCWGLLYHDEVSQPLKEGQQITGYVRRVRDDGKVDVGLQPGGYHIAPELIDRIIGCLEENQGVISITDKSNPETIQKVFGVSKKKYKMALGYLYKQNRIVIENNKVTLINVSDE